MIPFESPPVSRGRPSGMAILGFITTELMEKRNLIGGLNAITTKEGGEWPLENAYLFELSMAEASQTDPMFRQIENAFQNACMRKRKDFEGMGKAQILNEFRNKNNLEKAGLYRGVEDILAKHDIYLKDLKEL